jgi:hypothetical protein
METIKIDFTKTSEDGTYSFSDALHLPINHSYTEEQIEAMKQARFDNWLNMILNPPAPVVEETPDDTAIIP